MKKLKLCFNSEGKRVSPDSEECDSFIRTDISIEELIKANRWDPDFWDPVYDQVFSEMVSKHTVVPMKKFEEVLTYGPIVVNNRISSSKGDVFLINQEQIEFTGLDLTNAYCQHVKSPWVVERAMPKYGDLILARSGVGGVGKNKITIFLEEKTKACVQCFVDLLRVKGINPFYLLVFWKTKYGWTQIQRFINGVGPPNISFDEIRSIKIPILNNSLQKSVEKKYKEMHRYHQLAMKAKVAGNISLYQKNIVIAESLLKDLIQKTEEVIRGDRKSI